MKYIISELIAWHVMPTTQLQMNTNDYCKWPNPACVWPVWYFWLPKKSSALGIIRMIHVILSVVYGWLRLRGLFLTDIIHAVNTIELHAFPLIAFCSFLNRLLISRSWKTRHVMCLYMIVLFARMFGPNPVPLPKVCYTALHTVN